MRTRMIGAALVGTSAALAVILRLLVKAHPHYPVATPLELVLATLAIVGGLCGLGMLVEGRAIFGRRRRQRTHPRPRGRKRRGSATRFTARTIVQRHKP